MSWFQEESEGEDFEPGEGEEDDEDVDEEDDDEDGEWSHPVVVLVFFLSLFFPKHDYHVLFAESRGVKRKHEDEDDDA